MADTKNENLKRLLDDIDGASLPAKMSLAIYMCILMYKMHNAPASSEAFEEVWKAGIKAHRAACGMDFLKHITEKAIAAGKTHVTVGELILATSVSETAAHKVARDFDQVMQKHISDELRQRTEAMKGGAA